MTSINIEKNMRLAIKQGNIKKIKQIIMSNKEILHQMTPFGSWLHVAATFGKLDIIKYLIDCGLDPNIKGGTFNAGSVNRAASRGYYDIVKYLLSCGAGLETSEPDQNPLFAAIYGGCKDIVQLLLDSGIDYTVRYTGEYMKDMDAYDFAVERGQLEIAELIKNYK